MWHEGRIGSTTSNTIYQYWAKVYETGSEHGINQGKVSKLTIRKVGETRDLYNYDRGLDVGCANDEVRAVLSIILAKYN
ncbi:MAG: hypothetical protein FWF69_07720 [Firmicutes bacterium]|nr:hypothetical protein [Bacillota bacterium]